MRLASIVAVVACLCTGCGGEKYYPVDGIVRVDGKPLETGTAVLFPDDGRPLPSDKVPQASLGVGGAYRIVTAGKPGAPAGKYRVAIIAQTSERPKDQPPNPMKIYPLIDAKYFVAQSSPLRIEVSPTAKAGDYDLAVTR